MRINALIVKRNIQLNNAPHPKTCFLCEGNDHVPIQCPIYPIVQQMKQDGMHQLFGNPHEETTSTKKDQRKVRTMPHKAKSKVTTKCCYSCEEEGHISSNFPKKR